MSCHARARAVGGDITSFYSITRLKICLKGKKGKKEKKKNDNGLAK